MSINPLSNTLAGILGNVQRPGATTDPARARVEGGAARPAAAPLDPSTTRAAAGSIAQPAQSSLPVAAPAGTDPELWSILTGEERAFFAKVGSMGPLTYGRMTSAQQTPPSARGIRLDVKV